MTLSITAAYVPPTTLSVAGYQVTVSGLSGVAGASTVTGFRQTSSGALFPLRGITGQTITVDSYTTVDFEFSYQATSLVTAGDDGWSYFFNVYNAVGAVIATVGNPAFDGSQAREDERTLCPLSTVVLQSIQQPALSLPVIMGTFSDYAVPGRVLATHFVLGRPNPVVISDISGGRTGSFTILFDPDLCTYTNAALKSLITFNDTFMLQPFYRAAGIDDMYFRINEVSVNRGSVANALDSDPEDMGYTLTFTEVDRPLTVGEGASLLTWQNVLDQFAGLTWNDVLSDRVNWLDVLNQANNPP